MRNILAISLLILLAGCGKKHEVSFSGTAIGVKNGVFLIKNTDDSTVYGENIKDGKFAIGKRQLRYEGYYLMNITNSDSTKKLPSFEIYLEIGDYKIEVQNDKLYKYPKITSSSKIQNELSAYYTLYDQMYDEKFEKSRKLNKELNTAGVDLSVSSHNALTARSLQADSELNNLPFIVLSQYAKANPQSEVSAHLMAKQNYEIDPVAYYNVYKSFSIAAKNSDDGKELGSKLGKLVKLAIGAKAPGIVGKTPDGQPFEQSKIKGKVILIDFWRASNEISRRNHKLITDFSQRVNDPKKFAAISVSIDTKADWWITAVNDDHMTWPQISDLKGDDSPNAANWAITKIPTYYLLNDKWEIIDRDFDITRLNFEVFDYLDHHH